MAKKYTSTSNDRKVQGYLKPRVFMMFEAESDMKLSGKSEHVQRILTAHYDNMPISQQNALIEHYHKNLL